MLKLNPRHVHFVHLQDGTKEGTHNIIVEGFNDQQQRYEITLRAVGGPECSKQEARVVKYIHDLHALGADAHITTKYYILLVICGFVGSFFEPHYKEE